MGVTCEINFDQNEHGIYFAGQTVTGNVVLKTNQAKTVKGLALRIRGGARTKWEQRVGGNDENFFGREDYINMITYLLGSECETTEIPPGIHNFNFATVIPQQCPSSFEGKEGYIRYTVRVILIRPWEYDQTYSRGFTVLKLKDLNYDSPVLRQPAVQETNKTFFCGPCTTHPLKMSVSVPQTGFVPGQNIIITVRVTNESSVPIFDLETSLNMLVIMFSQEPSMQSRPGHTNLVNVKEGPVNSRSTRTVTQVITVPATPATCFNLCRIIKISYELKVEAKLGGMHQNPIVTIPITIGNVPLGGVIQLQPLPGLRTVEFDDPPSERNSAGANSMQSDAENTLPKVNPRQNLSDPLSSADINIPPPTYEEAIHMAHADCNEEDQHPLGQSEFLPRYPVYSFTESIAPLENETFTNIDPMKTTWL